MQRDDERSHSRRDSRSKGFRLAMNRFVPALNRAQTMSLQVSEVPARNLYRRHERYDCQPEDPVALTHLVGGGAGNHDGHVLSAGTGKTARTNPRENRVALSLPAFSSMPRYARRRGFFCISRIRGTSSARLAEVVCRSRLYPCRNSRPIQRLVEAGSHSEKIQRYESWERSK